MNHLDECVWRSEEDGRKLLDAATTKWAKSDTVNRPTRLDTQSSSATPANDGQTLSSTDAATATGRPALRAERECSRPTQHQQPTAVPRARRSS